MINEEFKAKLARLERQKHQRRHISKQEILRPVRDIAFPMRPEEAVAPLRHVSLHHKSLRSTAGASPVLDIIATGVTPTGAGTYKPVPIGYDPYGDTIVKRYGHAATYTVNDTVGAVRNTVEFLNAGAMYEVVVTGCFIKYSVTADGDTNRPTIILSKGASDSTNASADMIHAQTYRQTVFIESPAIYGYSSSPEPTPDTPDVFAPEIGEFRENFAIHTLIVPQDDLTSDILSIWCEEVKSLEYELVIKQIHATYD